MVDHQHMTVLVTGFGSREHALVWKIAQSPLVGHIYAAPGNAGTAQLATNVDIDQLDIERLADFAEQNGVDLTVVGSQHPLNRGIVDLFERRGLTIFGPTQRAAQLECSKSFAKGFMQRHNIPTPAYATFDDYDAACAYVDEQPDDRGLVVKISGLGRQGQGVTVCDDRSQAYDALHRIMVENSFGSSGETVVIEERISGPEVSFFAICDGVNAVPILGARDYKRIYEGDLGPNTSGMGAYAPLPEIDACFIEEVTTRILQPTIDGMRQEGIPYKGILYAGLMVTDDGIQLLEYNCRLGNPEAIAVLPLWQSDIVLAMLASIEGRLAPYHVRIRPGATAAVVVSAAGYPDRHQIGIEVPVPDMRRLPDHLRIFQHATECRNGHLFTNRGRIFVVSAVADDLPTAIERAYAGVDQVAFEGSYHRRDVGLMALPA